MNNIEYYNSLARLSNYVQCHFKTAPRCHDWDHTYRVLLNAYKLISGEIGVDVRVVEVAALLHDIARPEEMAQKGKVCHAALGSVKVRKILPKFGFKDVSFIDHVSDCVFTHRYRDERKPETMEAKIIFDADKLDSIGAIGLGRAFHFAGRFGARVHNSQDEALASESYSQDDTAYREFLFKLKKIKNRMLTDGGREIALKRHEFMVIFFQQFDFQGFLLSF